MTMKRYFIPLLLVLLLAGCGIYRPYSRPQQLDAPETADTLALSWRDVFADPMLQQLIDTALVRNADLRTAKLRTEEAEANLLTARLSLLPSFNLSASATTNDLSDYVTTITGNASWQLDIFASLTNAKRQAKAALMGSEAYRDAVQTQLIADVAACYYTIALLREQYDVTAVAADAWSKTVETARAMKDAGMVTEAAVAQYEATYWSTKASLSDYEYSLHTTMGSLCSLLCLSPIDIKGSALDDVAWNNVSGIETLPSIDCSQLIMRPDIRQAESQLMQSYYATAIARAKLYPSLTLTGTGATDFDFADFGKSIVASVLQPVFNATSNRTRVKVARLQQEEALTAFTQTLCDAAVEVDNLLAERATVDAKTIDYDHQVEALERAAESTDALMQYGSTSVTYLDVLTARRSLLTAQLAQLSNDAAAIKTRIALFRALGLGTH